MKKEIRKDVREYILSQVNETLARLGVSEQVVEAGEFTPSHDKSKLYYRFESSPIHQMPMLFRKLYVKGEMISITVKEGDRFFEAQEAGRDIVVLNLEYSWDSFRGGSNGTEIGRMIFLVDRELPDTFEYKYFGNTASTYVWKAEGLSI